MSFYLVVTSLGVKHMQKSKNCVNSVNFMAMFNFMAVFSKVSSYLAQDQCNLFCSNRIIDKGSTELQKH